MLVQKEYYFWHVWVNFKQKKEYYQFIFVQLYKRGCKTDGQCGSSRLSGNNHGRQRKSKYIILTLILADFTPKWLLLQKYVKNISHPKYFII